MTLTNCRDMLESRISAGATEKLPTRASGKPDAETISSWSYEMEGHAKKCVERYCELANKTTQQSYKVATPCMDDHQFKEEENESVGELSAGCSQIVFKCLYLADISWSVNKLARAVTKWTIACDKRLARLISFFHHTSEYRQYCYVGNTAQQCRLGLFEDSDFAGDLEDSKSTSGGVLCIFGSHTFVPISWMHNKQTSVSHSSTVPEIVSLDSGLRMDGIPALDLWDLVIEIFHSVPNKIEQPKEELRGDPLQATKPNMHNLIQCKHTNVIPTDIDHISSNTIHSGAGATLYTFEDHEAVIKMIIKGRSPTMRHVSRTHRVALDWLFDRMNLDPKIQIRCIVSKHQIADILTNGNFTRDEWNNLLHLFTISHFSSLRFQLDQLHYDGEKNSGTKRRRKGCVQVATTSEEYVFIPYGVKFLCRIKFDSIEKSGDVWSFGETQ